MGEITGCRPGFQYLFYERRSLEAQPFLFCITNKTWKANGYLFTNGLK